MINKIKNIKGITLIALIITIIVLLILSGVVVNITLGNDGIIAKAQSSVDAYQNAQEKEEYELAKYENMIDGNRNITEEDLVKLIQREIKKANEEKNTTVKLAPVGTIISCIRSSIPDGYLVCDGTKYSATEYPNLYNALKDLDHTGWKEANWTTEFTVPDLQGEFLRGTGANGHENQGNGETVIGKHQDATEIPNLWSHDNGRLYYPKAGTYVKNADSGFSENNTGRYLSSEGILNNGYPQSVFYTDRPTNTSVLYCIKY